MLQNQWRSQNFRGWRCETGLSPPVKYFTDRSKAVLLLWIFYVFVLSCVCYVFVRVCLYVLCGHLLGKGWPLGDNHFYHIRWAPLSVTIFIMHMRILRNGSYANVNQEQYWNKIKIYQDHLPISYLSQYRPSPLNPSTHSQLYFCWTWS